MCKLFIMYYFNQHDIDPYMGVHGRCSNWTWIKCLCDICALPLACLISAIMYRQTETLVGKNLSLFTFYVAVATQQLSPLSPVYQTNSVYSNLGVWNQIQSIDNPLYLMQDPKMLEKHSLPMTKKQSHCTLRWAKPRSVGFQTRWPWHGTTINLSETRPKSTLRRRALTLPPSAPPVNFAPALKCPWRSKISLQPCRSGSAAENKS